MGQIWRRGMETSIDRAQARLAKAKAEFTEAHRAMGREEREWDFDVLERWEW